MAQDVLDGKCPDFLSSAADKKWAAVLLQMYKEACYDPSVYAEWHHITAICMFGSIVDLRNYIRLRPELHLMVHAALLYFFPSILGLGTVLIRMLDGAEKGNIGKNLSKEELANYLKRAEEEKELIAFARMLASFNTKKRMALKPRIIPQGVGKGTKQQRLGQQRRQLRTEGTNFFGPYTQEEVDRYIGKYPNLDIKFSFYPQKSKAVRREKRDNKLLENEEPVELQDQDIIMGINIRSKQRGTQLGNIELKKQIEKYYSVYKAVPQGGTNWHRPNLKQALCYEVLHLMEENGYRFVTATGSTNDRKWFEPTHRDIVEKIANDFGNLTKRKENPPSGLIGEKKRVPSKIIRHD